MPGVALLGGMARRRRARVHHPGPIAAGRKTVGALVTTAYVSSTGGHLSELLRLADRLGIAENDVWVTHDCAQSREALEGRRVIFVPEVAPRNVGQLLRALPGASGLLRRHRPRRAVSSGAGIALAYLPYLAQRGVGCHYVKSATR